MQKATFILFAIFLTQGLSAQLLNSVVNVSPYYPDANTLFLDAGDVTISTDIEYPVGSYVGYKAGCLVDITDNQIIIGGAGTTYSGASFNGWILEPISGVNITGATLDASSDVSPVVSLINGRVEINFQGITSFDGAVTTINIESEPILPAVPTLSQWGLIILGLVVLILGVVVIRQRQMQLGG